MKKINKGKNCQISRLCVHIDESVVIGDNVVIDDNVTLQGKTKICDGTHIYSNCWIENSIIGKGCEVKSSFIEGSVIGDENQIGPFTHIRPGTKTSSKVKLGSFVEIKNSSIGKGTKASHLAYVGDALIGQNVNIGCGVIFANFNGKEKRQSIVKDNAFIGCNSNLIAPVEIGEGAYICAGTTVTKDVAPNDFVIGRVRQEHKPGEAERFLK